MSSNDLLLHQQISFAKVAFSPAQVDVLYNNRGACLPSDVTVFETTTVYETTTVLEASTERAP